MHILSIGINHTTAPIELRERLVFREDELHTLAQGFSPAKELIIVSTCNRTELYSTSSRHSFAELEVFLSHARHVPLDELRPHLYHRADQNAIHHLMRVAAGLDSLVLGEPQILGQVTRALELARSVGLAGPLLTRLFQAAIHAGKRARSETEISRNPASVSSLAASVAEKAVGNVKTASVVVLGAGEMAELTVEALRKRGVERIRVINRTLENAQKLAHRWGAEPATFDSLPESLTDADILIASTGAPQAVLTADMVRAAQRQRPLLLIDIALPRDIEPACAVLPGVLLYDLDSLNAALENSLAERAAQVPQVEAILAEESTQFLDFMRTLEMLPLITDLRQQAEAIRQAELEKTLRRLPDLTDQERERIDALTQALVKKLLETPTRRLRAEAACQHAPEYATVARTLFGLGGEGLCGFAAASCHLSLEKA